MFMPEIVRKRLATDAGDIAQHPHGSSGTDNTAVPPVLICVDLVCRSRLYLARFSYAAPAIDSFLWRLAPKWTLESACKARAPFRVLDSLMMQEGVDVGPYFREARFRYGIHEATMRGDRGTLTWWFTRYHHSPTDRSAYYHFVFYNAVRDSSLDLISWLMQQNSSLPAPAELERPLPVRNSKMALWLHERGYQICVSPLQEVENGNVAFIEWALANAEEVRSIEVCLKIAVDARQFEMAHWLLETFPDTDWCEWIISSALDDYCASGLKPFVVPDLETIKWIEMYFPWKRADSDDDDSEYLYEDTNQSNHAAWVVHCIKDSAARGNMDIVQYLYGHPLLKTKCKVVREAAEKGHLKLVKWLHQQDPDCAMDALNYAAHGGHLNVVRWVHGQIRKKKNATSHQTSRSGGARVWRHYHNCLDSIDEAVESGSLELVKWLHKNRRSECSRDAMSRAACMGNLEMVQFLHENRDEGCYENTLNKCAEFGHFEVMKFFHENEYWLDIDQDTMDLVAASHDFEIVKWLHENRSEDFTAEAVDGAARSGRLNTVKFLLTNRTEGCTTDAMDDAAAWNHLSVVQWLHENRSEGCTTRAADRAARSGNLEIVQFLLTNRTEGCTTEAMDGAATCGHLEIVRWLHENRHEGCTQSAIDSAALHGHLEVVKYLHQHRQMSCSGSTLAKIDEQNSFTMLAWILQNDAANASYKAAPRWLPGQSF